MQQRSFERKKPEQSKIGALLRKSRVHLKDRGENDSSRSLHGGKRQHNNHYRSASYEYESTQFNRTPSRRERPKDALRDSGDSTLGQLQEKMQRNKEDIDFTLSRLCKKFNKNTQKAPSRNQSSSRTFSRARHTYSSARSRSASGKYSRNHFSRKQLSRNASPNYHKEDFHGPTKYIQEEMAPIARMDYNTQGMVTQRGLQRVTNLLGILEDQWKHFDHIMQIHYMSDATLNLHWENKT